MINIELIIWVVLGIVLVLCVFAVWLLFKPKRRPQLPVNERPVRKMYFGCSRKIKM